MMIPQDEYIEGSSYIFVNQIIPKEGAIDSKEYNDIARHFYLHTMLPSAKNFGLKSGEKIGGKIITSIEYGKTREEVAEAQKNMVGLFKKGVRSHFVILGAGASKACLSPFRGDKNGRQVPLMDDLIDMLSLRPIIEQHGIKNVDKNFEEFYSSCYEQHPVLASKLEEKIYQYFASLKIPDEPTIYDYLVLCLREKDCIATFNWDPLLFQAAQRNYIFLKSHGKEMPRILYLHGNTAIGYCLDCKRMGYSNGRCGGCGSHYTKTKLIYPIKSKNYSSDTLISSQWRRSRACT